MFGHMHRHGHGRRCGPRGAGVFVNHGPRGGWVDGDGNFVGRARGRRMFDGGELRLVLLKLIGDQPLHGYELIKAIEAVTNGAYAPSPGVVYPTLTLLDEMGLIEQQESEGAKKRYAITAAGQQHLEENANVVAELIARLTSLGEHRARTDGGPIRRAMHNLRAALQERLTRGEFSEETVHEVAALLDEVAQKIERLK